MSRQGWGASPTLDSEASVSHRQQWVGMEEQRAQIHTARLAVVMLRVRSCLSPGSPGAVHPSGVTLAYN